MTSAGEHEIRSSGVLQFPPGDEDFEMRMNVDTCFRRRSTKAAPARFHQHPRPGGGIMPTTASPAMTSQIDSLSRNCACGGGCPRCAGGTVAELRESELTPLPQSDIGGPTEQQAEGKKKLSARRFQDDPILDLVMDNLLTLKNGSRGVRINVAVKKIQRGLIDAGFPLPKFGPDGLFGSETEAAVRGFQQFKQLPEAEQDGKVGPITMGLLDRHFATGQKPRPLPPEMLSTGVSFQVPPKVPARYATPEPFVDLRDNGTSLRLDGPQYALIAPVVSFGEEKEVAEWDIGHIQDLQTHETEGLYSDGHSLSFEAPLPMRDSAFGPQQFPWYNPKRGFTNPAVAAETVGATITDTPGVSFPMQHDGARLTKISLGFKAIDWVTVRHRNTGETRFLHHVNWGFQASVEPDPNQTLPVPGTSTPGVVVTSIPQLPEPVGTNDEITQAPGVGSVQPTMSEAVFNFSVRLVRKG